MKKSSSSYVSLFSGAGGLDLGLQQAGFFGRYSVEIDPICRQSLQINNPQISLSDQGDIADLSSREILNRANLKKGELDLLAGGPPCQPFSKSGYWANSDNNRMNDPRANTLREFMRVVGDVLPHAVLIENVSGISYSAKNDGVEFINRSFDKINKQNKVNYRPELNIVNAADYGVPQIRQRVFIVAFRNGQCFKMPSKTHRSVDDDEGRGLPVYSTAWDAIGDLDTDIYQSELEIKGKWAGLVPSIPEGENYLWHTDRKGGYPIFGWRTRYWSFLLKLAKTRPSWTITAKPGPAIGPLHWKNRYLSTREMARLQTFPDAYEFSGSRREQQCQIGNAVPPAIGELFGREIRSQLFGYQSKSDLTFIPSKRTKIPDPEKRKPVPKVYRELSGDHLEHPGTGKGPGAVRKLQRA